jgi:hypothetical protein
MQRILIGVNRIFDNWYSEATTILIEEYLKIHEDNIIFRELNNEELEKLVIRMRTNDSLCDAISKKPQSKHGFFIIGKDKFWNEDIYVKIVEVPDNVRWHICQHEHALGEHVCEDYRIWE